MIWLANAIHSPGPDVDHPEWDTMIVLRSLDSVPIKAIITLRDDSGIVVPWPRIDQPDADSCEVTIEPGLMWAATFLPGNGFTVTQGASAGPPQNWRGGATIQCFRSSPFGWQDATDRVIAFFLLAYQDWRTGINAPHRTSQSQWIAASTSLTKGSVWRFAYAIPYFDDAKGATQRVWTTGIEINNQDAIPTKGRLVYTIGQNYIEKRQQFLIPFEIKPYAKLRFDLYLGNPAQGIPGLKDVGYPTGLNSEGHFDIFTDQLILLQPSALIADTQYTFTVTEDFS